MFAHYGTIIRLAFTIILAEIPVILPSLTTCRNCIYGHTAVQSRAKTFT
jgi:hypothetical protein